VVRLTFAVGFLAVAALPAGGDIAPDSGTYTGYYHVDRWGGHSFAGFPVEPPARAAFKNFPGTLVTADLLSIHQPLNPGTAFAAAVGKVTAIKDVPVEMRLAWADGAGVYRRVAPGGTVRFTLTVTNRLARPLGPATVRGNGFTIHGVGGANLRPGDAVLDMAKDLRGSSSPSREWNHSDFVLPPGASRTWRLTLTNAVPGEYEFAVVFAEYRLPAETWLHVASNDLRLDVPDDRVRLAAGLRLDLVPGAAGIGPVPARLVVRNVGPRPVNFCLPYRGAALADDQLLRCFDAAGTMLKGPRPPATAEAVFGDGDHVWSPARLAPRQSLTVGVWLPAGTELAAAVLRGGFYPSNRRPDEDYFLELGPSRSRYVVVRP